MSEHDDLIPRPPVVRERLAQVSREAARLRRLLRLSEAAARERHERALRNSSANAQAAGGGR
ncbi:hypothetical protein [Paludisphaera rhizosphaerae]|uniref:hypothetical protein n=1 Tax=Paludisphaera rhizosphaerae TaxID=2711216 RepID=UPI0013EA4511|nr:hypothetical protein [Paludisphaera rhizosphaerae]